MASRKDDVRLKLREAALALFREQGYERTTAAQIAGRAGVTERTFFRHFPDKREVLFDGEPMVRAALTASIADAPAALGPLDVLFHAFRSFRPMLEANRPYMQTRQAIISATPALQERETAKIAAMTDALAGALRARGVADMRAAFAAQVGMAAFTQATLAWHDDPEPSFGDRIDRAREEMLALFA